MTIVKASETETTANAHGIQAQKLFTGDVAHIVLLTMRAGESLKPHSTPTDVFFYVLEGECDVEIGGEKERVAAESIVFSPENIPHCIYNTGGKTLRVLVIKTPAPKSETKFLK